MEGLSNKAVGSDEIRLCTTCMHRMSLANHGIHWCEMQVLGYPDMHDCGQYQQEPGWTIASMSAELSELSVGDSDSVEG